MRMDTVETDDEFIDDGVDASPSLALVVPNLCSLPAPKRNKAAYVSILHGAPVRTLAEGYS